MRSSESEGLIQEGLAHLQAGRLQEAEAIFQSILRDQAQHPDALHLSGLLKHRAGEHETAVALIEDAIKMNPTAPAFHNNCGEVYRALDNHDSAIACYEQALALNPNYAEAHYNLGNVLQTLERQEEARVHYEQALSLNPDFAEAHYNLGISLQDLGRQEDAIARYEQTLALKPNHAEARRSLTLINPSQQQIPALEKLLADPSVSVEGAIHCHFALGDLFDRANASTEAFEHFRAANALKRKTITYDPNHHSAFVDRLIKTYTEDFFAGALGGGSDSELPVFIVGMPRSGTTLVEQIVSSHPQVYGAGELACLRDIEEAIAREIETTGSYPEEIASFKESVAARFSEEYLDELRGHSQATFRITDKMPSNFMRVGLIKTLFPNARIVHCERNALDTCSSIFINYLVKGHDYSFELKELGQYYLDYERLMVHWSSVLPNQIFAVRYEDLVANQEPTSRRLVQHLGLEWKETCLDFHENKRAVKTASNLQVRQPIYKNSVDRWRRYEKQLAPLVKMLEHHL